MKHILFQQALLGFVFCGYGFLKGYEFVDLLKYDILLGLVGINLISIWLTHKHKLKYYQQKTKYIMMPFVKSLCIQFVVGSILWWLLFSDDVNADLFLGSLIAYSLIELLLYTLYISIRLKTGKFDTSKNEIAKFEQTEFENIPDPNSTLISMKVKTGSVPRRVIDHFSNLIGLDIKEYDQLDGINGSDSAITEGLLNDVRRINKCLIAKNKVLNPGGVILCSYESLDEYESRTIEQKKGPGRVLFTIYYYLFKRGFPKIPVLKQVYFLLTGGKGRVISRAEVWGRLSYCGFDVINDFTHSGINYVLAQKTKTISENPNPTYSPIITLNRVSIGGKIIKIHKVRSMYPYSEFIQKRVFDDNDMTTTGKVNEDFRITKLGKIYRKFWIDELPQILDWLRGEIKVVGIRAMSQHFFSLYPEEYKKLFVQVKPGIISPIFDEDTVGFDGIVEIEQKYLESYLSYPVKTDIKYFFITFSQIVNGVRSQ